MNFPEDFLNHICDMNEYVYSQLPSGVIYRTQDTLQVTNRHGSVLLPTGFLSAERAVDVIDPFVAHTRGSWSCDTVWVPSTLVSPGLLSLLYDRGYHMGRMLHGYVILPNALVFGGYQPPCAKGFYFYPVIEPEQREDYIAVFNAAYQAEFGAGLDPEFGARWTQFNSGVVSTWIMYDGTTQGGSTRFPMRAEMLYRFGQFASLCAGVCHPDYRGLHIGDKMVAFLLRRTFETGVEAVFAWTTDHAAKIAERFGGAKVMMTQIWFKKRGGLVNE